MSRRSRRQRLPVAPVTLDITSLSHEGRGVGHIEGKVAFVEDALPGETVSAQYLHSRRQFAELRSVAVIKPAETRVEPPCEYATVCGGCSLQHLAPGQQLAFKEGVLLEHLKHNAGLEANQFNLLPRLTGPSEHYRRKARLAVRIVQKKGGALVGFREKSSSFITDMNDCQVLVREVAQLLPGLRSLIDSLAGRYEIPQIEVAAGEHDSEASVLQVALVFRHLKPLSEADQQLLTEFAGAQDIHLYLQPGGVETVHKLYPAGPPDRLFYYLPEYGLKLAFHPMDFTQINGVINRQIIDRAIAQLDLESSDSVLDLFCGLGNFTLPLATRCATVLGVEGSTEMVQRGVENARDNGLGNVHFAAADLTRPIAEQSWLPERVDKIILDPPRSGAQEIVEQVAGLGALRIVYVSCNPVTLARDSDLLIKAGYELKSAGVMDMFPHTAHVESMAVFVRQKSN